MYSTGLVINGFSVLTGSGRILQEGYSRHWGGGGGLKNSPSKGGLIREGGLMELLR